MSAWLNIPVAIVEDERSVIEEQTVGTVFPGTDTVMETYRRTRKVHFITTRYVGAHYDGAKAKKTALLAMAGVSEVDMPAAGAGQYHALCIVVTKEAWSAWALVT